MAKVLMRCVNCEAGITQNWEGYCGWIDGEPYCWDCFTKSNAPELAELFPGTLAALDHLSTRPEAE